MIIIYGLDNVGRNAEYIVSLSGCEVLTWVAKGRMAENDLRLRVIRYIDAICFRCASNAHYCTWLNI